MEPEFGPFSHSFPESCQMNCSVSNSALPISNSHFLYFISNISVYFIQFLPLSKYLNLKLSMTTFETELDHTIRNLEHEIKLILKTNHPSISHHLLQCFLFHVIAKKQTTNFQHIHIFPQKNGDFAITHDFS